MEDSPIYWSSDPPSNNAEVTEIDDFNARGMRRVYGRGDHFGRHHTFHLDIWMHRSGRLMMRCWSRCSEIDDRSFEIKGIPSSEIPHRNEIERFQDSWLPEVVRKAYEQWISEEF